MNTATLPTQVPVPTQLVHDVLPPEPVRAELVAPIPVRHELQSQSLPMGQPGPLPNPISDSTQVLPQAHQAVHVAKQDTTSSGRPILAIAAAIVAGVSLTAVAIAAFN